MEVGLKLTVTPVGWPLAVKAIAEAKPPETAVVIVELPLLPCTTETDVGEAEMVNAGVAVAVTVSDTFAVCVIPPPVPVTVIA
jgi:cystathionine beta-lyase/cystathionine gamma-synthase